MESPVVIVTGASGAIGRAIAQRLGRERWRLVLVGRDDRRLRETDALLAAAPATPEATEILAVDLADAASARAVVESTLESFGRVDALVNNAGAAQIIPVDEIDEELVARTFAINAFAPIHLLAAAWPSFRRQRSGVVVNVSSLAAVDPFPGFLVYGASKAALDGVTRSAAIDGASIGVKAYSLQLGAVETPMLRSVVSTEVMPPERALDPRGVAEVVWECIAGLREFDNGRSIPIIRR